MEKLQRLLRHPVIWISLLSSIAGIAYVTSVWRQGSPVTIEVSRPGWADLRGKLTYTHTIPLDCAWMFTWRKLLAPLDTPVAETVPFVLPQVWNVQKSNGKYLPAHGYGTFQLRILLDSTHRHVPLALYIPFIHSAYRLWVNGVLVATDGRADTLASAFEPGCHTQVVPLPGGVDTLALTLHVANYAYAQGGVWQSPRIGSATAVMTYHDQQLAFDLFIFGGLFIMSLYHIALYFLRRRAPSNLYFGLLCLFLGLKNLFTGEVFFYTLWPDASYELGLKCIHISLFSTGALLWLFLRELFSEELPAWVSRVAVGVSGVGIFLTLVSQSAVYSQAMMPYLLLSMLQTGALIRGLYLALRRQREGALIMLIGFLCFVVTVLHDLAIDLDLIQDVYLSGAGFFMFIFSQAFLLATKFTHAFQHVERLTDDLKNTNRAYSRFVPREFLAFLNREAITDVKLGDQLQGEMTVFFSDIRSYTTLSEQMTPAVNFAFINDYLRQVVYLIHENEGVVNQYLGDGIMALFMRSPEDALLASIQIQRNIRHITALGGFTLKQALEVGMGIHTGPLMLGMIGDEERMSPGVISDTVNTASRLEGLTKFYGAQIVISESTLRGLPDPDRFQYRFLGKVQVKGKQHVVPVYEILDGLPQAVRQAKLQTRTDFEQGLAHYFAREFYQAQFRFERVLETHPDDVASQLYLNYTIEYLVTGVPAAWEGAVAMQFK
ncbi:MAG: adenylate/guanylate cyclase domain-containing protein [Bacteroidia bacterium]|nr:adenylate/guanylate cyclase domain-containing protein [Bacteroidia bacterium]